ncbi:hypothetical protein BC826DRAFT_391052 [Russula brevipes]|nr:hypothetical protein BC826DRAFT_391052 [Russula brevipes]
MLPAKPLSTTATTTPSSSTPSISIVTAPADAAPGKRKAGDDWTDVPGERQGGQKLSIRGQYDRQRHKRKESSPNLSMDSRASTPASAAEDGSQSSTLKRVRTTSREETPSLLLRMGQTRRFSPAAGGRRASKSKSSPMVQPQRSDALGRPHAGIPDLSLGISIKGAARSHSHSLLERIQGDHGS